MSACSPWICRIRSEGICRPDLVFCLGTLLLIASDVLSDAEFTDLGSFWMWEPVNERWIFVRDWDEHKQEAGRKFEEHFKSSRLNPGETEKTRRPPRNWIH